MPIYEYRCENGHTFEVMQRMTEDPVSACTTCGAPVQRVFHPVAVHFKGKGFYNTDYGTRRRNREQESSSKSDTAGEKSTPASTTTKETSSDAKTKSSDGGSAKPAANKKKSGSD